MSRLQQVIAQQQRGSLHCYDCNKRLTQRALNYKIFTYPAGTTELVPVCRNHKPKKNKKESSPT